MTSIGDADPRVLLRASTIGSFTSPVHHRLFGSEDAGEQPEQAARQKNGRGQRQDPGQRQVAHGGRDHLFSHVHASKLVRPSGPLLQITDVTSLDHRLRTAADAGPVALSVRRRAHRSCAKCAHNVVRRNPSDWRRLNCYDRQHGRATPERAGSRGHQRANGRGNGATSRRPTRAPAAAGCGDTAEGTPPDLRLLLSAGGPPDPGALSARARAPLSSIGVPAQLPACPHSRECPQCVRTSRGPARGRLCR